MISTTSSFCSVYGPVDSWRFGRSLGIDPIGLVSTCPFDCVYCQLGEIEQQTQERQVFVPTQKVLTDLHSFAPWDVDVITLSGSGEPTLALNLGEILAVTKGLTGKTVGVLTNGSLLNDPVVRDELTIADQVSVKLDAITADAFRRINRPVHGVHLPRIWNGLQRFAKHYKGHLAIQTMVLSRWSELDLLDYIALMRDLTPDEIHLNTPIRPRPLTHQLDARGNHSIAVDHAIRPLKPVSGEILKQMGDRIHTATQIPVRYPQ
jgi:wyosine [tRNA(Phe)-imidazoG37] synthetase (radical SAM superfamily)